MHTAPTFNAFTAPQWAAVVSGVAWKSYSLAPDGGAVSVEVMRGPVIVWAKTGGEEKAVKLTTPTPSPLEVRALEVNTAPHFERFRRAARGRVRHSIRWKTGARVRRTRKLEALRWARDTARQIQRRAEGRTGLQGQPADWTAKGRRAARQEWRNEYIEEKLQQLAPGVEIIKDADGSVHYVGCVDTVLLQMTLETVAVLKKHRRNIEKHHICINFDSNYHRANTLLDDALFYALAVGDFEAIAGCVANLKARRWNKARVLLKLLERQRDAYRAHLTRRVKPVARRTRIPRPLYARPRPPTAPLAPPVI